MFGSHQMKGNLKQPLLSLKRVLHGHWVLSTNIFISRSLATTSLDPLIQVEHQMPWLLSWCLEHVWELLNDGLNHWLITWGDHWVSRGSTGEGNSTVQLEGVEPGCTSLRPHLRADCYWGRISLWRSLLLESFWWVQDMGMLSIHLWLSLSNAIIFLA